MIILYVAVPGPVSPPLAYNFEISHPGIKVNHKTVDGPSRGRFDVSPITRNGTGRVAF